MKRSRLFGVPLNLLSSHACSAPPSTGYALAANDTGVIDLQTRYAFDGRMTRERGR